MTRSRTYSIICVATIAIALFCYSRLEAIASRESSQEYFVRQAKPLFSAMTFVDFSDSSAVETAVKQCVLINPERLPEQMANPMVDDLRKQVIDFISFRFGQSNPLDYIDWRRSLGCSFNFQPSPDAPRPLIRDIVSFWSAEEPSLDRIGQGDPVAFEQVFTELWEASRQETSQYHPILKMAVDRGGIQLAFGSTASSLRGSNVSLGDQQLHGDYWYGGIGSTCPLWLRPETRTESLSATFGHAFLAEAGIIVENSDGTRFPMIIYYYWDQHAKLWQIDQVCANNYILKYNGVPCAQF